MKTIRTNSTEFKKRIEKEFLTMLNNIEDGAELETLKEVANYSLNRFNIEGNYKYAKQRHPNKQNRLKEYLQGLPFGLPFNYVDIINFSKRLGTYKEGNEDQIISNYWNFISFHVLKFWERHADKQ